MKIGIIGLGSMGRHIARHIVEDGFMLTVYDIRSECMQESIEMGAIQAGNPKEVGKNSQIVILMVNSYAQCMDCLTGNNGLLQGMKDGILIVSSTIAFDAARAIESLCFEAGLRMLDAPVSGGTRGAMDKTLTVLAAGNDETYNTCLPVLRCMGNNIIHVGSQIGQGQKMKAINQLLVGIHMVATAEAFSMAAKCGLDLQLVFDTIKTCAGTSRIFENRGRSIIDRDFSTRSTLSIQVKDMDIIMKTAASVEAPIFLGNVCRDLFKIAEEKYTSTDDSISVIKIYEDLSIDVHQNKVP
jgi:3-hydroxyisobutyrate dehydrogenase-like beta-hydroxyacid dehydrogenase